LSFGPRQHGRPDIAITLAEDVDKGLMIDCHRYRLA
jgi:hypothetical protein